MKIKVLILAGSTILAVLGAVTVVTFPRARLTYHVIGEDGQPIPDATVQVGFGVPVGDNHLGIVTGQSDANGNFTAEGEATLGNLGGGVTKDGYYWGGAAIPPLTRHADGHWLPWDAIYTCILRKIGTPIPMYVRKFGGAIPSAVNEPCGFDLEEGDWVTPYGKGKMADLIVTITYLKYIDYNNNEATGTITFSNNGDGLQEIKLPKEFANSRFKWPREAPELGYQSKVNIHHLWSMSGSATVMTDTLKGVEGYFFPRAHSEARRQNCERTLWQNHRRHWHRTQ